MSKTTPSPTKHLAAATTAAPADHAPKRGGGGRGGRYRGPHKNVSHGASAIVAEATGPVQPVQPQAKLPAARHIPAAPKIVIKDECMWKDAVFQPECPLAQINPRRTFSANSVAISDLRMMSIHVVKDKPAFARECPPEPLAYYAMELLCSRFISLCMQNAVALTSTEQHVYDAFKMLLLNVPEPLLL